MSQHVITQQRFGGGKLQVAPQQLRQWGLAEVGPANVQVTPTHLALLDETGTVLLQVHMGPGTCTILGALWHQRCRV